MADAPCASSRTEGRTRVGGSRLGGARLRRFTPGDIEILEKEIDEVPQKDLIKKNYEILHKIVEDYQIYLRDKKLRKVKHDDLDYKLGRIYTLARKYDNVKVSGLGPDVLPIRSKQMSVLCKANVTLRISEKGKERQAFNWGIQPLDVRA
ncbi:hypothetical protein NDU88_001617 [Pleurodeles waltl]|uniref:Uncharacterized protein n=1 Tax=Pleurodeles waltl TaxID=8319 RepID=A0AAV7LYG7_PLEWA|nr:hypothetical protein NDU88_001617 [Pleurodeles waltl]